MSLETRSNSALFKRAEQLKRWEESDTNREPVSPKQKSRKIKFSSGCVFLAACAAGDKDEVVNLLEKGADINTANVDGLTALHQACIDDNLDMVEFLVEHGADVNRGDNEGWTPLHATASCGFLYIAKYLIEKGANVAAVNNDAELAIDIAECQKMEDLLKEEIEKRGIDCDTARNEEERTMLRDAKDWLVTKSSLVNTPYPKNGATPLHVASAKGYTDVIKVLLQCGADIDAQDVDGWTAIHAAAHWGQRDACQLLVENLADLEAKNFVGQTAFDLSDSNTLSYLEDLKQKQNKEEVLNRRQAKKRAEVHDRTLESETPSKVKRVEVEITNDKNDKKDNEHIEMDVSSESESESESSSKTQSNSTNDDFTNTSDIISENEVPSKKNSISQKDEENIKEDIDLTNITVSATITTPSSKVTSPAVSPQSNNQQPLRSNLMLQIETIKPNTTGSSTSTSNTPTPTSPGGNRLQIFKNFFKSFVPPVRDEESETQRKAHAKRVRETRRSTQGVTLEEIKSAEQFVKKKNQPNNNNNEAGPNSDSTNGINVTATITTASPTVITRDSEELVVHERRPSWRLRVDNGTSKFKLEDATKPSEPSTTPAFIRRTNATTNPVQRPSSAPIETADTTVTLPLRRPKSLEEKEQDKENDIRNAQATLATQAAIQRRRRPKRRSTGVVSFDNVDDLDKEKEGTGGGDCEDTQKVNNQSGSERNSRTRLLSTSDIRNENGEIDYKKLYEQQLAENDRLKDKFRKSEEELRETKQTLERINVVTSKNSLSELEKRERRAMERKLSEMEEELKNLEHLKTENQRLKDENGALIRVISKLSK